MFLMPDETGYRSFFTPPQLARLAELTRLHPAIITRDNFPAHRAAAADCEVVLTSWSSPVELLTAGQFPKLKAVFYCAGSVKGFASALSLRERGIVVVSARHANSVMVARFCLAQILLGGKGYFRNTRDCRDHTLTVTGQCFKGRGAYQSKVALLGLGMVARELCRLLQATDWQVLAVDPYLGEDEARRLNLRKVSLATAFREAVVVSNHLPNLPALRAVLNHDLFAAMPPGATFINTGRGAQVNEAHLLQAAGERPDLTFLLDVTDPEPPPADSPLYRRPNVQLSSHIAGVMNGELPMLGGLIVSELERYCAGRPLQWAENLEQLDRLG
jgi:phosphoglycerate dehydrogenase-like enzyme